MNKKARPRTLKGATEKHRTPCGNLYVTLNKDDKGEPFETVFQLGKSGQCLKAWGEGLSRMITTGLRHGIPLSAYVKQLKGIKCPHQKKEGFGSCLDTIGTTLEALGK